jgi:CBS domain containing-hemolysin-like protein
MVGEIYDEFDEPAHAFVEETPGCFRVQAQYLLADLESHLPFKPGFPLDRGYDTVGGLLMDLAGKVPQPGEMFTWPKPPSNGQSENDDETQKPVLAFTVLSASKTGIDSVRMKLMEHAVDVPVASENR